VYASWNGHTDVVEALLAKGAVINYSNNQALYIAILNNKESTALLLLKNGATFNENMVRLLAEPDRPLPTVKEKMMATDLRGALQSAMEKAAANKSAAAASRAAAANTTALKEAVYESNLAEVQRLITAGADVNAVYDEGDGDSKPFAGDPLLVFAVRLKDHMIPLALINAGAKVNVVNARTNEHVSPLVTASANGHDDLVTALLAKGADVHFEEDQALYSAIDNERESTTSLLLQHRATFNKEIARLFADGRMPGLLETLLKSDRREELRKAYKDAGLRDPAPDAASGGVFAGIKSLFGVRRGPSHRIHPERKTRRNNRRN